MRSLLPSISGKRAIGGVLGSLIIAAAVAYLVACTGAPAAEPEATATLRVTRAATSRATPSLSAIPTPTVTALPTPWPPGAPWTGPAVLPILMYHHVTDAPPGAPIELESRLIVTRAEFSQQLEYLRCVGYTAITVSQLFDGIYNGAPLPPKPIILTFDDGYADAFSNAMPLLQQHGFRGTFGIVTGYVGAEPYVSWPQVVAMAGAGMEIVSHSVTHEDLNKSSDEIVREQVVLSKAALEEHLGRPVEFFTYPSGEPFYRGTEERQRRVVEILREAGYRGALAVRNSLIQDPANPYALNRVRVNGGEDLKGFAENILGPPPGAGC